MQIVLVGKKQLVSKETVVLDQWGNRNKCLVKLSTVNMVIWSL